MAKDFSNDINVGAGFALLSQAPLDARFIYETKEDMLGMAATSLYDGLIAYVKGVGTFQYSSSNTVDAELGKWREFGAADESNSKVTIIEGKTAPTVYKFGDNTLTEAQYNELIENGTVTVSGVVYAYTPAVPADADAGTEEVPEKFTMDAVEVTPVEDEGEKEFAKVYEFYQGSLATDASGKPVADESKFVGKVNIPLDLVVSKGYCAKVYVDEDTSKAWYFVDNDPGTEAAPATKQEIDFDKFKDEKSLIVLHIANKDDDRVIIPISDLKSEDKEIKVYETFANLPNSEETDTLAYVKSEGYKFTENDVTSICDAVGQRSSLLTIDDRDEVTDENMIRPSFMLVKDGALPYLACVMEGKTAPYIYIHNETLKTTLEGAGYSVVVGKWLDFGTTSTMVDDIDVSLNVDNLKVYVLNDANNYVKATDVSDENLTIVKNILSKKVNKKSAGLYIFDGTEWSTNNPDVDIISDAEITALF